MARLHSNGSITTTLTLDAHQPCLFGVELETFLDYTLTLALLDIKGSEYVISDCFTEAFGHHTLIAVADNDMLDTSLF
jgi:hypothetical protein